MSPAKALPRHPIDLKADAIRASDTPRQVAAEAIDEVHAQWYLGQFSTHPVTVKNWTDTLWRACIEREGELHGRALITDPEPWREL